MSFRAMSSLYSGGEDNSDFEETNDVSQRAMSEYASEGNHLQVASVHDSPGNSPYYPEVRPDVPDGTPLHKAARLGKLDQVVSLIAQNPGDVHTTMASYNETPLHIAAERGHVEVVEALLRNGANVRVEDARGWRPLELALNIKGGFARPGRDSTVLLLLKSMTEREVMRRSRSSHLPVLCRVSAQKHVKSLQWILRYSRIKSYLGETRHGRTLLYDIIVLGHGYAEVAMLLLNHSAPIKGISPTGNTALHFAAEAAMSDVVEALLFHDGCSHEPPIPEALSIRNSRGHRPLECACAFYDPTRRHESERTVTFLLWEDSLSYPIPDGDQGWTALHWAVFYNRPYLVSLLVSKGADLHARDYSQRTPADLAESVVGSDRRSEMMQWLRPRDTDVRGRGHDVIFSLTRPRSSHEVETLLGRIPCYIADVYRGASMETSGFSMCNLLYEFGPSHIMNVVESQAAEALVSTKGSFALRWIHLPANNVSAGAPVPTSGNGYYCCTLLHRVLTCSGKSESLDPGTYKSISPESMRSSVPNPEKTLFLLPRF